jgi:hypothetical protein
LTADVFTSTTGMSPNTGSTRLFHTLSRIATVRALTCPCAADHDSYTAATAIRPTSAAM